MSKGVRSAGLLPFRFRDRTEVLLGHPGGPYFSHRDNGWWSILKGLVKEGESDIDAAAREFSEETGWPVPEGIWAALGETKLRSRKAVIAWAVEADLDPDHLIPGHFWIGDNSYPEIDRVAWFSTDEARDKLNTAQAIFIDRLEAYVENGREYSG